MQRFLSAFGFFAGVFLANGESPRQAEPVPSPLFGDHAVIQAGTQVPIWGLAGPGRPVHVAFCDQAAETVANGEGRWMVRMDFPEPGWQGELVVESSGERQVSLNVVTGEVWLCAGQSNMEWNIGRADRPKEIAAAADHPGIRQFLVEGNGPDGVK